MLRTKIQLIPGILTENVVSALTAVAMARTEKAAQGESDDPVMIGIHAQDAAVAEGAVPDKVFVESLRRIADEIEAVLDARTKT